MKSEVLRFIIPAIIILLIDFYTFQAFRTISSGWSDVSRKILYISFWSVTLIALGALVAGQFVHYSDWPKFIRIYLVAFVFIIYLCKLVIIPFLLIDDVIRLIKWVGSKFSATHEAIAPQAKQITRSEFISQAAIIAAGVPFVAFIYGMVYGGFNLQLRKVRLTFKNLPKSFDGLRIVQISDIHSGSFMDNSFFSDAVKRVNELEPDIIFFTGDLVNNVTSEVYPFTDIFSRLKAPMGVYSILGNHDYGDYADWDSKKEKAANLQALKDTEKNFGWHLLLNQNVILERNGLKIGLAGVENWSASNRFPKYGDLTKALSGLEGLPFTILLSHDPSHWDAQILKSGHKVDLTLSGHTHGMQFGIETKWFRWSPSQYFYKEWAGLYKNKDRHLYVNRGLGFLGYPGRAGINPEITQITLHSA